ncbi:FAD/NAD(P)-binding domain-containing protein [Glonium stellatum]|uniref:FAD/NAD(P)-binding domain-containing protein n=1 Tax=Glonium stellatum TaxID=574774 RepID=A0A8E2JUU3_9PEZI|nr:FAD/NAD(P)-binding domain-containing protein [Glonium stellatum]
MVPEAQTDILDVAIIGAGWYGLKAARTYLDLEPNTNLAVFDGDDSVGGVWSKGRIYPNLVAQVGFGYFNYPGMPMSRDGEPSNHLVSGEMIQRYLEKFAVDNDLMRRIRFKSWVEKVERCPRGWRLKVNGSYVESAKLIICSGVTSVPSDPPFKVEQGANIVHSRDIARNLPAMKAVESVVVVGAAKSAYDAVYLLCSLGKRVTWIIRPDGSGPMPIMPHEIGGLNTITVGSTRLMSYLSPSIFNTKGFLGSLFHRTVVGRWLTQAHWGFITGLSEKAAGFGGKAGVVEPLKPDISDRSCFWCDSSLGLITMTDFWSTLKGGNLRILRDNVDVARKESVVLRSGQEIKCDYVLTCTGWGDHFGYFSPELKEELGIPLYGAIPSETDEKGDFWAEHDREAEEVVDKALPLLAAGPAEKKFNPNRTPTKRRWRLYNRCIPLNNARTGDRSLAILGQIHTTQTPTIAGVQSIWAISYMLGEIDLPDEDTMIKEIAEYLAWVRKRYSSVGERYPYALFDWIPYLDKLLGDIGLKSRRKTNFVSEFFSPYGPHCYADCLDEYKAKRTRRTTKLRADFADNKAVSSGSDSEISV